MADIRTRTELKEIIAEEQRLWATINRPKHNPKSVHSKEILFVKALRHLEYCDVLSQPQKLWGGYCYWLIVYKILSLLCRVSIPRHCIDRGLVIMHLQNIILSNKVRIGQCCCLFHNTTVGIKLGHDLYAQCPQIGDGVTICVGAVIVGPVTLNDGITVAANAVVTKSFEEKDVVIGGIPAKRISIHPEWSMLKVRESNRSI